MKANQKLKKICLVAGLLALGWLIWQVSAHLWFTGSGWCWGSASDCVGL
jgi:hypothetical protein